MKNNKMLKVIAFILMLSMVLCFSSCGDDEKKDNKDTETSIEDLEGKSLYEAVNKNKPNEIKYKFEVKIGDMEYTMTTYMKGDNYRTESENNGQKTVSIINSDKKEMYTYVEGQNVGYMYSTEDEEAYDDGSNQAPTIEDYDEDLKYVIVKLEGKKAMYIEDKSKDDGKETITKIWFSLDYAIPLKVEVYNGDKLVYSGMTKDIETEGIEDSLFEKPKDIEFKSF